MVRMHIYQSVGYQDEDDWHENVASDILHRSMFLNSPATAHAQLSQTAPSPTQSFRCGTLEYSGGLRV